MPATLTSDTEKTKVRKAVPTSKILIAAVARLYVASPDPRQWTYTKLWGAATLLKDAKKNNSYYIRLINIEHSVGAVVWEQELYADFAFNKDAPFFYTFDTDDFLAGLEFVDQEEGEAFYRKLQRRGTGRSSESEKKSGVASRFLRSSLRRSKIAKSDIGKPENFTHVSHVGYKAEKGFNFDGKNNDLVKELQALGISESEIEQNQDFIMDYLQQHGSRRSSTVSNSKSTKGRRPPPPPPPRRIHMNEGVNEPIRSSPAPPPPPPPPSQFQNRNGQPPPPPPPPLPARHPNQSPASPVSSAANDGGRSNLMASIRATGGFGSLKQGNHLRVATEENRNPAAFTESITPTATPSPQDDLASSLADVLHQRKMAMESDEEMDDDDDDDWD
ncbi:hypothetical protein BCR42DRAFT_463843 [Absidia repens]|uniref:WH1 domain-domain-containing protein n=1 Tax=Absidia repens TaxID=90262 RepID=A0A1X2J066_9FUNG|nr:hypothetical protein BCR42DRAFT_463843 [Absidia repens]